MPVENETFSFPRARRDCALAEEGSRVRILTVYFLSEMREEIMGGPWAPVPPMMKMEETWWFWEVEDILCLCLLFIGGEVEGERKREGAIYVQCMYLRIYGYVGGFSDLLCLLFSNQKGMRGATQNLPFNDVGFSNHGPERPNYIHVKTLTCYYDLACSSKKGRKHRMSKTKCRDLKQNNINAARKENCSSQTGYHLNVIFAFRESYARRLVYNVSPPLRDFTVAP